MIVGTSIKDQVYNELRNEILRGNYKSGEQLNPKVLSKRYGVSVMPVRDALLHLVQKHLVVNRERVGFFVANYTISEMHALMEMRKLYELYNIEWYFGALDKKALIENHEKMKKCLGKDKNQFDQCDILFHNLIIRASNNIFLEQHYSDIECTIALMVYKDIEHEKEAYIEHERIIQAIVNGDKATATMALNNHLNRIEQVFESNMK